MKKGLWICGVMAWAAVAFTACEKNDEVPPTQKTQASSYKLPDPTPLTQAERDVISAQEQEYNENAK